MRILSRYILKELLFPFIYALLVILFILFTNFLLRAIDRFLGKGLPFGVIIEYLFLNIAWILALAVPMAVLVAVLMAFGRFSEDNEITALRASGVSFKNILWPALAFSITIAGLLIYFNNAVLPHMNHKARMLSRDIYRKRPDINIVPGYFIDDLPQYGLIVQGKKGDRFQDVKIYSKENRKFRTIIHANEGEFSTIEDAIVVTLYNGNIHELDIQNYENYRRILFEKHQIIVPEDNLSLKRRESASRSDREMTVAMMREKITTYREKCQTVLSRITRHLEKKFTISASPKNFEETTVLLDHLSEEFKMDSTLTKAEVRKKERAITTTRRRLKADFQILEGYKKSINRYGVEIHKKFSIPIACIVFVLVGTPLGVMAKKGGLVTAVSLSFGFFLIYWAFLIGGEELADRNFLTPVLAMWSPNILLGAIGIYLSIRTAKQKKFLRLPFTEKIKKKGTDE